MHDRARSGIKKSSVAPRYMKILSLQCARCEVFGKLLQVLTFSSLAIKGKKEGNDIKATLFSISEHAGIK